MSLTDSLEQHFGYSQFRTGQEPLINSILEGKDVLGILPTGGGKSICYQLPAVLLPYLTIVITPLISLMKDQVDSLHEYGIPAAYIHSGLDYTEIADIMTQVDNGTLKLLYVAPERLNHPGFINNLPSKISMIAIDEAHCVSQWGHDFRPSYRQITDFIDSFNTRPIVSAFTATATPLVQQDISNQLGLKQPETVINSFDRPNIRFTVVEPDSKSKELMNYINDEEAIIIYANTRKNVDQIYERLLKADYNVCKYHAGLPQEQRDHAQNQFIFDKCNIIVATNAFGMGIDKTDVRRVIHYNMPTDLESYYQEAGRAGRDGLDSEAILFFSAQDIISSKRLLEQSQDPYVNKRLDAMIQYANATSCLRKFILNYFDEDYQPPCKNCSSCLNEFEVIDVTKEAQMILSNIVRMKHGFGMTMVAHVLRGVRNDKIVRNGFDQISTFGLMKDSSENYIKDIISRLLAENQLTLNEYNGLVITEQAKAILFEGEKLTMKFKHYKRKANIKTKASATAEDEELFEVLRGVRSKLAQKEQVPAYIICNNKTLVDMANQAPTDMMSFLQVDGIGQIKAEKYYEPFTEAIIDYQNKN
ncbi:DNA helicase RecQ [Aerococcaceae bacterium DSM 111022]|nr:DNA helicase RecQ [Aerococcaceae bacterium DSM 111022]